MNFGAPPSGQALCTRCGLCCTGALHDFAKLDEQEVEKAAGLGLSVERIAGKPSFCLGCPRLEGTLCGIYPDRPQVCGSYACRLLSDVDEGRKPLDEGLAIVREAQRLHAQVTEVMPEGMRMKDARSLLMPDAPYRPEEAALRLRTAALSLYLDRHFRNDREGPIMLALDLKQPGASA